jgi:hypothetical protein
MQACNRLLSHQKNVHITHMKLFSHTRFLLRFHETGFVNKNSPDEIFIDIISQVRTAHSLEIVATNRSETSITKF